MALERPPRRVPLLTVVVAVVAAATLVGLVVLWPPTPDADAVAGAGGSGERLEATITAVEALPDGPDQAMAVRLTVEVTEGTLAGRTDTVDTQLQGLPPLEVGDRVMLGRAGEQGETLYVIDVQRSTPLAWLALLFVGVVVLVGRWHGVRSLLGLGLSLVLVVRFVVPAILVGSPPALVALVGAVAIMLTTLYLAHGFSQRTTVAVVATTVALALTVGLGLVFVEWGGISGFASEEARFARVVVEDLDVAGLVLAGLIIAALGVLDDVTVAQSSTAWALHDTDPTLTAGQVFRRAMAVGRDHIASTVNTLFLAYAGASLSLLVLFSTGGSQLGDIVTSEVVATEVVKTLVGSLGLVSAVPLTTALAAVLVTRREPWQVEQSRRRRHGDDGHGRVGGEPDGTADDHGESLG